MALSFKSLVGLQNSADFVGSAKIVFHAGGSFYNGTMDELRTYFTEQVNSRIDDLNASTNTGPSIWPTQRTLALTGLVTGSVLMDGSANAAIATSIADGALSIAKTTGLATALQDIHLEIEALEATVGDGTAAALDGKADKVHSHTGTEATTVNTTYASNLVGVNASALGATYGTDAVGIVGNNGAGRILALFANGAGDSIGFKAFANNAWSVNRTLWHDGNFKPTDYQPIISKINVLRIGNALQGQYTSLEFWGESSSQASITRNSGAAGVLTLDNNGSGGITLSPGLGRARVGANEIWTAGNFTPANYMLKGSAKTEIFTDAPTVYPAGSNTNCDNLPAGRAKVPTGSVNSPGSTFNWYIETITTDVSNSFQRAVNPLSGETWNRVYASSAWSSWRRVYDNTSLVGAGYMRTGAFGLGGPSLVAEPDSVNVNGFYYGDGTTGPVASENFDYLHLQATTGHASQLAVATSNRIFFRSKENTGSYGGWNELWHTGNFTPASKLDASVATLHGMGGVTTWTTYNADGRGGSTAFMVQSGNADSPVASVASPFLVQTIQSAVGAGAGHRFQFAAAAIKTDDPELFYRTGTGGAVGDWAKILTNVNTDLSKYAKAGVNLTNTTNLNTVTGTGYYQQLLDASATTALSYPAVMAGMLTVTTNVSGYTYQEYRTRDGLAIWTRALFSGTWSNWARQYNSGTALSITSDFTTTGSIRWGSAGTAMFYQSTTANVTLRTGAGTDYRYFTFNGLTGNVEVLNGGVRVTGMFTSTGTSETYLVVGTTGGLWRNADGVELVSSGAAWNTLAVRQSGVTYNNNQLWHAGNFNPSTKVTNNAVTVTNASSRVDAGFFQASNPTSGFPTNGSVGWYHLISSTHNNGSNYYALQFAAQFDEVNNIWVRNTGGNGSQPWRKIWHSGNITSPFDAAVGGNILGTTSIYTGAWATQVRVLNMGWNNGLGRWAHVMESDGTYAYYGYDTNGGSPVRLLNFATTSVGGENRFSINGRMDANKVIVTGTADAHIELQPAGVRVIRFTATSSPDTGIYDLTNAVWLLRIAGDNKSSFANEVWATDFVVYSDARLKDQIEPLESRGRLNPVRYRMKSSGKYELGFLAHEVQAAYPEVVTTDADGMLGVTYPRLVPVLAKDLNDTRDTVVVLQEQIVALQQCNEALEARLAKLEMLVLASIK